MSDRNEIFDLEKQIRMGMNLVDHDEFNETIRAISHIAAQVVGKTLGPYAHTTIIDDGHFTYPTKDGWTILNRLQFQDPTHASIYTMLKNISFRIVDKVGDGTTTAMVTADNFMEELTRALETDTLLKTTRQADIVKALNDVRAAIVEELQSMAIQIAPDPSETDPDYDDIFNVAYVSSNGNAELATIVQDIYKQTGQPNIMVDRDGGQNGFSFEVQNGFRIDATLLMAERYRNTAEGYYTTNAHPHMLVIFDHNVTYQKHGELINSLLRYAAQQGRPIIFMAPYYDDLISSQFALTVNDHLKQHPNTIPGMLVMQVPELTRSAARNALHDFAVMANTPITDATKVRLFTVLRHNANAPADEQINDPAAKLDEYQFTTAQQLMESCAGEIVCATIGRKFINLEDDPTDHVRYKELVVTCERDYEDAKKKAASSPTDLMKDYLEVSQRLNRLRGSIGVIHVGGVSDLERACNMDVVDDVVRACRSAYENGIVPGMNLGTLVAMRHINVRFTAQAQTEGHCRLDTVRAKICDIFHQAFWNTTEGILHSKQFDWTYDVMDTEGNVTDHVTAAAGTFLYATVSYIDQGLWSSYDIVNEMPCTDRIPSVCNSVATDIEILYGIVSILGMILTSDQYLSVNRAYDKAAAIRQQEAINARGMSQNVSTIMGSVQQYIDAHGDDTLVKFLKRSAEPFSDWMKPVDVGGVRSVPLDMRSPGDGTTPTRQPFDGTDLKDPIIPQVDYTHHETGTSGEYVRSENSGETTTATACTSDSCPIDFGDR